MTGVSYALLYADEEANVIDVQLARECIEGRQDTLMVGMQLPKGDVEQRAEKRRTMHFRDVEYLAFSYRDLLRIDNLQGFSSLTKLKLDCNRISKIENLSSLTQLTWLDLSFNQIQKIEGLESLTALTDLVLFSNQISDLCGLDALTRLHVLSLGENLINRLDKVMYLRRFKRLEALSLVGNPISSEPLYQTFVLSHLKHLKYLDNAHVMASDIAAAKEQHQDEVIELQEQDEQQAEEEQAAAEAEQQAATMREANLDGVTSMFDDLTQDDPDWAKLNLVPGLIDNWGEVRDKFLLEREHFVGDVLEKHKEKQGEFAVWHAVVTRTCREADSGALQLIASFEKAKKLLVRDVRQEPGIAPDAVPPVQDSLDKLKSECMALEISTMEKLEHLIGAFDRKYSELVEQNKQMMMGFFTTVRDLVGTFHNVLLQHAQKLYDEKYSAEGSRDDFESLPDEVRDLMSDKERLLNCIQSSYDLHRSRLDALEEVRLKVEGDRANELVREHTEWARTRDRERIIEIITYHERNSMELQQLVLGEDEDDD